MGKANWNDFFVLIRELAKVMRNTSLVSGSLLSPTEAVADMKRHFFTTVLATIYCPGWSMSWAMSVAMHIVACYPKCSLLLLLAVEGGPACEEELAALGLILLELGFRASKIAAAGFIENDVEWTWVIERSGALPFVVQLTKMKNPSTITRVYFGVKESQSKAPNLKRVTAVSCAEKWPPIKAETFYLPEHGSGSQFIHATEKPGEFLVEARPPLATSAVCFRTRKDSGARDPQGRCITWGTVVAGEFADGWLTVEQKEKPSSRLSDQGKAVNDILNETAVSQMEVAERIAASFGYQPEADVAESDEATDAFRRYFCTNQYANSLPQISP